ncbi:phosphocholine cytidylyltransferase family protein [Mediterraneibacter agrestimuris]|uniref:phosphocholine cytidylyltransferase family protein n=1 Tax=Mediterraneibacter agrestimuris TaxID=2941333 RepID=UPI00203C3448|nr:phosphocholine cytidylyltransferase family protein [Mediterraneibacter agrestimuris]
MKAIIVAAGKGSRISEDIAHIPKSTLKYKNMPIIRRTVEILESFQVSTIVCTGYKYQKIMEALEGKNVQYYYNPFYEVTNNIASLWFAQDEFNDDILILSADVIFEENIIKRLIEAPSDLALAVDKSKVDEGDYFLQLDDNNHILAYGKDLPEPKRTSENIGIAKISCNKVKLFKRTLNNLIQDGLYTIYYEQVFFELMQQGYRIQGIDMSQLEWAEIDYYEDYCKVLEKIDKDMKNEEK